MQLILLGFGGLWLRQDTVDHLAQGLVMRVIEHAAEHRQRQPVEPEPRRNLDDPDFAKLADFDFLERPKLGALDHQRADDAGEHVGAPAAGGEGFANDRARVDHRPPRARLRSSAERPGKGSPSRPAVTPCTPMRCISSATAIRREVGTARAGAREGGA